MQPDALGEGHPLLRILGPDEPIHVHARASDRYIAVTDRRIVVTSEDRVLLDMPFDGIRRIQFDIERARPASLVVVPQEAWAAPQVLSVPAEHYREVAEALATIGERIAALE